MRLFAQLVLSSAFFSIAGAPTLRAAEPDAAAIFEKRLLPIFRSPKPSSCTECHLSGVALKDYLHPSQEKTFASLAASGMIDVKQPDRSKILRFIQRAPEKPSLISKRVREEEYQAFRAWIRAAVKDPKLLRAKATDDVLGPKVSVEVIRHARNDRVLHSFVDNVWSEVLRCAACHSPGHNQKQVKKFGERVSWIKPRNPRATMNYLIEAGLIDEEEPEKSLLLTKPTLQVKHGGGKKMEIGDRAYKQFRRFIDDYSAIVQAKYRKAEDLPKPSEEIIITTQQWLRITGLPEKHHQKLLQVDLYRWMDGGWSPHRVATSDRAVFGPKRLWQHSLSVTAPRGSAWAKQIRREHKLPPGRYLIKTYLDDKGKLTKDYTAELGKEDFLAQMEITSTWPVGYQRMPVVRFPNGAK